MDDFFINQADYFYLLLSLTFIVIAAASFTISKIGAQTLPWRYLTLFGITQGVYIWLSILQKTIGSGNFTGAVSTSLLIISALLLMEFGRSGTYALTGWGPGKWIILPALLLTIPTIVCAPAGLYRPVIIIQVLGGSIWAALALYISTRFPGRKKNRSLVTAGLFLTLYSAATILTLCQTLPPGDNFIAVIMLLRGITAAAAALSFWAYFRSCTVVPVGTRYSRYRRKYSVMLVASMIAVLGTGWIITQDLGNRAHRELVRNNNDQINLMSSHLLRELSEAERAVYALAGSPWITPTLISGGDANIARANSVLDRYNKTLKTSECYLLDGHGKTIASSNRRSSTSFVGEYYTFRPYFQQAIAGEPGRYFALGITSGERGFYASSPVVNEKKQIVGVTVIKKTIGSIEDVFHKHAYCFFINPQGVIFLSSKPEMLLHSLWPLTMEERLKLEQSLQFGPGPFNPVLDKEPNNADLVGINGQQLMVSRQLTGTDGWSIVLLSPTTIVGAYRLSSIAIISIFCLLIIVFYMAILSSRESEAKIAASERHYYSLVEGSPNCVQLFDRDGRFLSINGSGLYAMGWTKEDVLGKEFASIWPEKTQAMVKEAFQHILQNASYTFEAECFRRDGRMVVWNVVLNPIYGDDGTVQNIVGISTDVTERKLASEKLLAAHQQLLDIIEFLPDATFVIDQEKKVIAWNRALEELTGVPKGEIVGKGDYAYAIPFWDIKRPILIDLINPGNIDEKKLYDFIERKGNTLYTEALVPLVYNGKGAYLSATASPLFDRYGNMVGAIESVRDITQRKQMEEQLKFLGLHDQLTGLYNRAYFEQEMNRLESGRCRQAGIIICDVDGLKLINDTLGHDAGDELLTSAAAVIRDSFRKDDMVARIGGDEFAVLLSNADRQSVEKFCNRIREAIAIHNETRPELPLSISLGFATTENITSMTHLFKEADNNMYKEKLHHGKSARSTIIRTLVKAQEARNKDTGEHAKHLQDLAANLARAAGLPEQSITDIRLLAQLHDIGGVGIPDSILLKSGPLTPEEIKEMQRHCEIGHRIALSAPDLIHIADWILKHHEWWDGQGYPFGLEGTEIPLHCRILAVVDAFDAMTSVRPYRQAMSHKEALAEIKRCSGTQFDPELVTAFIELLENGN